MSVFGVGTGNEFIMLDTLICKSKNKISRNMLKSELYIIFHMFRMAVMNFQNMYYPVTFLAFENVFSAGTIYIRK